MLDAMEVYAQHLGVTIEVLEGGRADALAQALAPERLKSVEAVLVSSGPTHYANRERIVKLIGAAAKPAIYPERDYVIADGLMSYGPSVTEVFRRLAEHVDSILKGPRPSDIAVEQVTRIEFVVNTKAARVIGIDIPSSLLGRADEVIE